MITISRRVVALISRLLVVFTPLPAFSHSLVIPPAVPPFSCRLEQPVQPALVISPLSSLKTLLAVPLVPIGYEVLDVGV